MCITKRIPNLRNIIHHSLASNDSRQPQNATGPASSTAIRPPLLVSSSAAPDQLLLSVALPMTVNEKTSLLLQPQLVQDDTASAATDDNERLPWGAGGDPAATVDVDLDIALDELPIITRTNSFSLASPSFQVATHHMKVFNYEDEPEPVALDELKKLLALIFPVVATYVLEYLPGLICIMLVGHIDSPDSKEYVGAATLSTMVRPYL